MTTARIVTQLHDLGVRPGGVLLVHAGLKALGPVDGGATSVINGLIDAVGPAGTLLMPTLTYELAYATDPCFDQLRSPSSVGALTELFRNHPGVRRSLQPTHSVAGVGPAFDALVLDHISDPTPCGPRSPFHRMLFRDDAQVLFLGCGLRPNTCMHAVEELLPAPYLLSDPVRYRVIDAQGREHRPTVRAYGFRRHGLAQRYDLLGPLLRPADELRHGRVLAAEALLVAATAIRIRGLARLHEDPYAFVEPKNATG
jgi:aminoglycoside 3-N-acetyltransferase